MSQARVLVLEQPARHDRPPPMRPDEQTCVLVKPAETDRYAEMLRGLPDLAPFGEEGAEDATRLASLPQKAVIEKWTPTARYYNGTSDASAGNARLELHVTRYGGRISDIHGYTPAASDIKVGQINPTGY